MATQPTLAMIPSGYKDGKLYSVLPSDGVGDFDVTRGSNATRINKNGLIETVTGNTPRLNYPLIDGVVNGCPSLLLEPQRTNLIPYSEDFSNAYWTKSGSSVTSGFISPTGGLDAFKLVEDTSVSDNHRIDSQYFAVATSGSVSISIIAKYDGSTQWLKVRDFITNAYVFVNLLDNSFGNTNLVNDSQKIEDLGNGFKRVSFTYSSTSTTAQVRIYLASSGSEDGYTGDGTSGVYIFGAQVEQGSYATSYIKSNSGSTTTRLADTASKTGLSGIIGQTEGVLFIDSFIPNDGNEKVIQLSDGTNNNVVRIFARASGDLIRFQMVTGGGFVVLSSFSLPSDNRYKLAFKYKLNNVSMWANGVKLGIDTNCTIPSGLNRINFNDEGDTTTFYGNVKEVKVYDIALTDLELETLTSYTSFNAMALALNYKIQ